MAASENIGLIDYVVNNYYSIKLGGKNTTAYSNSDNTSAKTIVLSKKIGEDGAYYVVEAVPELTKGSAIHEMSAYIGNKKGHRK